MRIYLLELKDKKGNRIIILAKDNGEYPRNTCSNCEFRNYTTCVVAEMDKDYKDIYDAIRNNDHTYVGMNYSACVYLGLLAHRYIGSPVYMIKGSLSSYMTHYLIRNLPTFLQTL